MSDALERRISMIAGEGTFAGSPRAAGDVVLSLDMDAVAEADLGTINHSCDPTLGFSSARRLVARRDITAGEELTVDYATFIDDPEFLLRCHCETYRCRQLIEGTDWQIPQLQTRYAGHWTPRLQAHLEQS